MTENLKPRKADLAGWLTHAKAQLADGDVAGALQTLGDILQFAPDHREANNLLHELEHWEKSSSRSGSLTVQPQRNPTSVGADETSTRVEQPDHADAPTSTLLRPRKEPRTKAPSTFLIQSIEDNLAKGLASEALTLIDLTLADFPKDSNLAHLRGRAVALLDQRAQMERSGPQEQASGTQEIAQDADKTLYRGDLKSDLPVDLEQDVQSQDTRRESWRLFWTVHKKSIFISISVAGLLAVILVGVRLTRSQNQFAELSILSEPKGAKVYLDGEEKGTTPFQVRLELTSKERLVAFRLQLDSYENHEGSETLIAGQNRSVGPIKLLPKGLSPEETLYEEAVQAKDKGRLVPPEDGNALDLLNKILAASSENAVRSRAEALKQEIKADFLSQLNGLKPSEAKTEKALELLEKLALVDPEDSEIRKQMESFPHTIDRLKKQIDEAVASQKFLSGESGGALELLKRLIRSSPTRERPYYLSKRKEVQLRVLEIAKQKCQTRGDACSSFIELALKEFPQDLELKRLREAADKPLAVSVSKTPDDRSDRVKELVRKAEAAFSAGRYVLPEGDDAYSHANDALKQANPNSETASYFERARDLASESLRLSLKQVADLAGNIRTAEVLASREIAEKRRADLQKAKALLERIHSLGQLDTHNTLQPADIAAQIKDLDDLMSVSYYSVAHSHAFGGCKGKLAVSGHSLQYQTDDGKDAFSKSYAELKQLKVDKNGQFEMVFSDRKREFRPEGKAEEQKLTEQIVARIKHFLELRQRLGQR
jgi:tetratricopeptide (TPR) repeat protein